jgi:hypothetical protein
MIQAAGKMGWNEMQFYLATPAFFMAAYQGHLAQEHDRQIEALRAARMVAYYAVAPHLDAKSKFSMTDIIELPGDQKEVKFAPISMEEIEAFSKRSDEIIGWQQPS